MEHKKASEVLSGATQVSALILDADGNAVYYGRVSEDVNSTGTRITLPEAMQLEFIAYMSLQRMSMKAMRQTMPALWEIVLL